MSPAIVVTKPRPFSLWREELKRAFYELRGGDATPVRTAISVALGLFVGSLPIFGCHTPLLVVLSVWFRLDGAIAWIVSNVSNPFFAPALLTAEVQVGAWLWTGAPLRFGEHSTPLGTVQHVLGYLFLGAPVTGLALAVAGALVSYGVASALPDRGKRRPYRLPDGAPTWVKAAERVATRYASPSSPSPRLRTQFHLLRAKLLSDPVARLIAETAGDAPNALGAILDIGTGRGQLPLLLLELGCASSARGLDWDATKIGDATRAAVGREGGIGPVEATFCSGDVRALPFEPADTVMLIDLLHYFRTQEQDAILDRAIAAVRPGGRLLVREADADRGWRTAVTLAEERFFTLTRFNRGDRVCFRPIREIVSRMEAAGLRCSERAAWGKTPFSNVLVVGHRPAA